MDKEGMAAAIVGLGTALPEYKVEQAGAASRLAEALADRPDSARWARRIFKQCGVETRYTCEPNLLDPPGTCRYLANTPYEHIPTTEERMELYRHASVPLAINAATKALKDAGLDSGQMTHLITVSCTGMFLPGLDAVVAFELGMSHEVRRTPLQFLGCAAGLTALRTASSIVQADPEAKVLIISVELCTLHIQPSDKKEDLFGAAFFGDGAAASVVTSVPKQEKSCFVLGDALTSLFPGSAEEMVWRLGNHGFSLYLSPRIPQLIGQYVPEAIDRLLAGAEYPELWAIHPGGRGIVDTLQELCGLSETQTMASRTTLRHYGNLSSATIFYVLQEMRRELAELDAGRREGLALAFGPGLQAELMRFAYRPAVGEEGAMEEEAACRAG
ncbi:type III polyketide synthase [Paenibacillus silviterrae]|uniref:type III polyketide synthase n=1 Tax=Paenibacillus silviterrae TaxID=3242194 RepID=UPI002543CB50|nr:type III polyketide synthase [Paenibacillus chinjuensis]